VRARASALFLLALVLGGCVVGKDEKQIDRAAVSKLVLAQADLSDAWVPFNSGRQVRADAPAGTRSNPQRFGRLDGWIARFRRPGSQQTSGPLVIESRADLFDSTDGARDELSTARSEVGTRIGARPVAEPLADPTIGDEAFAAYADKILNGLAVPQDIIEFTLTGADDDRSGLIVALERHRRMCERPEVFVLAQESG
jgi:hypothetical protein